MDNSPTYDPKLSESDIGAIVAIIDALPDDSAGPSTFGPALDRRILGAWYEDDGSVRVRTGVVHGPKSGRGNTVSLQRVDGEWRVTSVGLWKS